MTDIDRAAIARSAGVPPGLADLIDATSEANAIESAERLAGALGRTRGPAPDHTQGARQTPNDNSQLGRGDIAGMTPQEIVAAQEAGRFSALFDGRMP